MILNQHWISSLMIYNMTIFLRIDLWSNQNWQAVIAATIYLIWQTIDHNSANTTSCFFYLPTLYLQDTRSDQVYSKVHTQPNWARRVLTYPMRYMAQILPGVTTEIASHKNISTYPRIWDQPWNSCLLGIAWPQIYLKVSSFFTWLRSQVLSGILRRLIEFMWSIKEKIWCKNTLTYLKSTDSLVTQKVTLFLPYYIHVAVILGATPYKILGLHFFVLGAKPAQK